MEKREILSNHRNISSILLFINLFSKSVIFTEILPKLRERGYPTVWKFLKFFPSAKNFRQVGLQYNSLVKYLNLTKFLQKNRGGKIRKFPQCVPVISTVWYERCFHGIFLEK